MSDIGLHPGLDLEHRAGLAAGVRVERARRERLRLVRVVIASDAVSLTIAAATAAAIVRPAMGALVFVWALASVATALLLFSVYGLYERDRRQIAVSTLDEGRYFLHALGLLGFAEILVGSLGGGHVLDLTQAAAV